MEKLHFKTSEDYKKWLAYGHIHKVFTGKTNPTIYVHGKLHKVKHR